MARWGQTNIEVIAAGDYITEELRQGIPMQRIYDALFDKQCVTVSYNSFRLKARDLKAQQSSTVNENHQSDPLVQKPPPATEECPQEEKPANHSPDEFVFNPISDLRRFNRGEE
ncbi:hypothetical protein [Sneathiella aquimaris]|uniref:hypothetical protein n=1 Tax=Sneathiella aquimaris TaxID=2599305 RepID=UPI00146E64AF|nr:hypothetical protein [Sneathiella aquimaris]